MPQFIIIGGSNGAGKTSVAYPLLQEQYGITEYVNADMIAAGLSPFDPDAMALEAGRIMLRRIEDLIQEECDFAIETTLASRSFATTLKRCKSMGYTCRLIFVWLGSADLAVERVRKRVASGGHNIPEDVIRRRYQRGIDNFFDLYRPIVDAWICYYNGADGPRRIARGKGELTVIVEDKDRWELFRSQKSI